MKVLITGDLHLTNKCPENRMDDYEKTILKKFGTILEIACLRSCDCILQPGDFSDSPSLSYDFFVKVTFLIKSFENIPIYTIWGQHDLRYRNKENTFLAALKESNHNLHLLGKKELSETVIYGSSYGEEIPEIENTEKFNILLTHRMIIKEKLWEGQKDFEMANSFLRLNKFDLIVSGDNHACFQYKLKNRYLFNLGSISRSSINQITHKPKVVIFDISTREFEEIDLPIEYPEKVFRLEKVEREREANRNLQAFISGLSEHKNMDLSFLSNLDNYVRNNKIDQEIIQIIKECSNG